VAIKFLTWARMAGAVALCASLNPSWTRTPPGTPGNKLELSGTWSMSKSIRIDKLCDQRPRSTLSTSLSFQLQRDAQLGWICPLMGDDHRVLLGPIPNEIWKGGSQHNSTYNSRHAWVSRYSHSGTSSPSPPVKVGWNPGTALQAPTTRNKKKLNRDRIGN
jgi:hypothetical protein